MEADARFERSEPDESSTRTNRPRNRIIHEIDKIDAYPGVWKRRAIVGHPYGMFLSPFSFFFFASLFFL
jgi:hypothetical protein